MYLNQSIRRYEIYTIYMRSNFTFAIRMSRLGYPGDPFGNTRRWNLFEFQIDFYHRVKNERCYRVFVYLTNY